MSGVHDSDRVGQSPMTPEALAAGLAAIARAFEFARPGRRAMFSMARPSSDQDREPRDHGQAA